MNDDIMKMDPVAAEAARACAERVTAVWFAHAARVAEKDAVRNDRMRRFLHARINLRKGLRVSRAAVDKASREYFRAIAATQSVRAERMHAMRAVLSQYGVERNVLKPFVGPNVWRAL